ncbi:MAG: hypothetical protein Q7S05_03815 [bacterium]|nr:hypothetical protein [bacterium]
MNQKTKIIKKPGQDGVVVRVAAHDFVIPGTQWSTRKANQDFQLSSADVSHTLTADEIAEIDSYL